MSYDASAQTLRCPFCGSERLSAQRDTRTLRPQIVVPFVIDQTQANRLLQKWLGSSWWRPADLASSAVVTKMAAVFVPYWVFRARTFTYWNADSSDVPPGARGDWRPVHGEHQSEYDGILIGASATLTPEETAALQPFDLATGVPPEQVDLDHMLYEPFTVQRKYARPLAHHAIEQLEAAACCQYVPGQVRNMKVNVRVEELYGEPVLLPVWTMAYRYRNQVYRFLINGQTGRATGEAPLDWKKMVLVAIAAIIAFLLFVALLNAL